METKLIISGTLPGENEIIEAAKGHWIYYRDMKQINTDAVAWQAKAQRIKPVQQANFIITWIEPNKKRDKDNIMAGQKFVFDGLVTAGVLPDDRWKQVGDVSHRFEVDRLKPRIEVQIIERVE